MQRIQECAPGLDAGAPDIEYEIRQDNVRIDPLRPAVLKLRRYIYIYGRVDLAVVPC